MQTSASALRVTLGDLLGQPVLVEDDERNDDAPAVRDALMTPRQLSRVLFAMAPTPGVSILRGQRNWWSTNGPIISRAGSDV